MTSQRYLPLLLLGAGLFALLPGPDDPDDPSSLAAPAHKPPPSADRPRPGPDVAAAASAEDVAQPAAYVADQVMLALRPGASLEELADRWDTEIARHAGRSGYAALSVPEGMDAPAFRRALRADPDVASTALIGTTRGAKGDSSKKVATGSSAASATTLDSRKVQSLTDKKTVSVKKVTSACDAALSDTPARASAYQWHLDAIGTPDPGLVDLSAWVVAVLDSGVAYETYSDAKGQYVQAPSLAGSRIVAPYDFINDDSHANDDHQHGTHIASLIASSGSVEGIAPGAALMPLKVLDSQNRGDELALVEALYHAVDNGAHVINMSLSFAEHYVPSQALLDALAYAHEAGVVMVAASGNAGASYVSWPAASPLVLAVGASRPDAAGLPVATDYGNRSTRVDLTAPGGDLSADRDADGLRDGMIAETIALGAPNAVGLWMFAGTSQAAAVASGAAVWMRATGASVDQVRAALQSVASPSSGSSDPFAAGLGAGNLDLRESVDLLCQAAFLPDVVPGDAYSAAILPYLADLGDGTVQPRLRVVLYEADGTPAGPSATEAAPKVYVTSWGESGGLLSCSVDSVGMCEVSAPAVASGGEQAWGFTLDAVVHQGVSHRPGAMLFASDALEILLAAMEQEEDLEGDMLAWSWRQVSDDPTLGDVAESFSAVNLGTGLSSSPLGLVFTRTVLKATSIQTISVDLDGTGLSSSPLGMMPLRKYSFSGTGLIGSPLGLRSFSMIAMDGTGLSSSPLGLTATSMTISPKLAYNDIKLNYSGTIMLSGSSASFGTDSATGRWLADGGWTDSDGIPLASVLLGSETLELPADAVSLYPSGTGSQAVTTK